jgi:hypothetical protein
MAKRCKPTTDGPAPTICLKDILGDLNKDCKVDFMDIATIVENWLKCNLDRREACRE